jgi:hypothetical protein
VTEESPSNPKESVLDCTNITWATKKTVAARRPGRKKGRESI